ncbi:MAG: EAL domain-containing protein [Gammaproteobacteria bacterium]|nr:EAL domain-containing protein [Gammaproteobacteria bacterium]MBU1968015.1 EAL domain-containing protein [Gammaproteobacteria bacterium]
MALLGALSCATAIQAAPLQLDATTPSYAPARHIDVLEDREGRLTIADIASGAHDGEFRPALPADSEKTNAALNFGYSSSTWWLRLSVDSRAAVDGWMLLEIAYPTLDRVDFFAPVAGGWQQSQAGDLLPFAARPFVHRNMVFPLQVGDGVQSYYLRVQSDGSLTVPLQLWRPEAFERESQQSYALLALYFGMLLALMAYNLLLYFSLRERAYLVYVFFVATLAIGLLSLSGMGGQFLWPDWPDWGNVALPFGFCMAGLFGTLFTRVFLDTHKTVPRHDRVLVVLGWLFVLTGLAALTLPYYLSAAAVSLLGVTTPFVVISSGIICLRRNHPGARWFLLAWTLLMIGVSVQGARNIGWIPTNLLTLHAIQIGSALEMLLLSFALADRINVLRRERDNAQSQVIAAMSERLAVMMNVIPDIVFYKDRHGVFLGCNKAFETLIGRSESEIVGKTDFDMVAEEHARFFRLQDEIMMKGGKPRRNEEWVPTADGRFILLEMVKSPLYGAQGEPIGLVGIGRDITERYRGIELERVRNRIFELLAGGAEMSEILSQIVDYVERSRSGMLCSILLLDGARKHLQLGAAPSLPEAYNQAVHNLPVGDGAGSCGTAAFRNERVIVADIHTHPYWTPYSEILAQAKQAGLVSCWSEPVRSSKGELLGTFAVYRKQAGVPDETDINLIQQASNLASIAIERKHAEDMIWRQANYDSVTGLPNRRLFRDRLEQELRKTHRDGSSLALMYIDLDRFKEVNDSLGHDIGDMLLIQAAQRIRDCVRESDTVARLGGDEFTVILPQIDDINRVEQVAENIVEMLAMPFSFGREAAFVSASIGITLYPEDADNAESLLKNADQAMYVAKGNGRNCFSCFTGQMQEHALHRLHLIRDLRSALPEKQLRVYFQPIVDPRDGRIVKAEALIRWQHPERGLVNPMEFIPVAEEVGLIHDIGNWVFREATGWMKRWHEQGYACRQVSVNKSPSQFVAENSHGIWVDYLREIGLPGECLVIEITEGLLLDERVDIMQKLLQFRDAGIQVAIDDFGTGYSALSYLKKFDIDYLKIDRSFVHDLATDPNDLALSEAIIVMAHKLGLQVVAEGVETVEQRDILMKAGCDFAQGYLYAKPMPAEEFDALLASGKSLLR